ncbi:MAG: glycosyltransferase family 2 protein [Candidatus Micrarchaeaceae archaeon]
MAIKGEQISVIMPVYNESKTLPEIMKRVLAQRAVDRLIIINDHSSDKSQNIIDGAAGSDRRITAIANEANRGKGYSVRKGLELVDGGIVIIQDADLEYSPEDYAALFDAVKDDTFVLGTRMRKTHKGYKFAPSRMANLLLTGLFDIVYQRRISDINTCYKVFRFDMIKGVDLKQDGFLIDIEILSGLLKKGYKVREVDITYKIRSFKEGKKIGARDAIEQAFYIISSRFR